MQKNSPLLYLFVIFLHLSVQGLGFPSAEPIKIIDKQPIAVRLKKLRDGVKEGVIDTKTKLTDLYHDTGTKVTELTKNVKKTIGDEIDYAHKEIAPTVLGIPYHYYGITMLLSYAINSKLKYNIKTIIGSVLITALIGHFVKWQLKDQPCNKKFEDEKVDGYG
jgi:hypothetical protein